MRGKHFAAERRARRVHGQDFSGLVANETAIPGPVLTGGGARAKRLGKQARERLRRRKAKERAQSSIRRPGRAQAGGPIDQVEQKTSCQEQAPPSTAAADNNDTSAAPLSCSRISAGDGRKNQEEFCARLSMNQRIVITNPEFDGKNLEGGRTPKKRGASKSSGPPIKQAGGSRGEGREREEKRTDAMNVVSSIISTLIDNTYDCAVVVAQRKQSGQPGGKIASDKGKGGSPEGSSGETDSESSDEETASSSEDDLARAVDTASNARGNWKLRVTEEMGSRGSARGRKRSRQSENCRGRRKRKEWSLRRKRRRKKSVTEKYSESCAPKPAREIPILGLGLRKSARKLRPERLKRHGDLGP